MSKKRTRRNYTIEQKVEILRRHLVDKVPVSDLCNELGLQPSVFYQWQRQVHDNLAGALLATAGGRAEPAREGARGRECAAQGPARKEGRRHRRDRRGVHAARKELGEP